MIEKEEKQMTEHKIADLGLTDDLIETVNRHVSLYADGLKRLNITTPEQFIAWCVWDKIRQHTKDILYRRAMTGRLLKDGHLIDALRHSGIDEVVVN
jgi:hypothetical protein